MPIEVWVALIVAIPSALTVLLQLLSFIRLGKVKENVDKVEKNTNSITERLGKAKFAEGEASGEKKEQQRAQSLNAEIKKGVKEKLDEIK